MPQAIQNFNRTRIFGKRSNGIFLVCLKDAYENFEKLRLNAIHLHPCHAQQQRPVNSPSAVI